MYIYIFETGEAQWSERCPSSEDRRAITFGILQVILIDDNKVWEVKHDGDVNAVSMAEYSREQECHVPSE